MSDVEIVEKLDGTGACCCRGKSGQIEYDGNVVGAVEERKQIVELKDEADLFEAEAAQIRPEPVTVVNEVAVQAYTPAARFEDAADDVEERRLPRTARAKECHNLAGEDLQAEVAQRISARTLL